MPSNSPPRGPNNGVLVELPSAQTSPAGPTNTAGALSVAPATDSPNFPMALKDAVAVANVGGAAVNAILWQADTTGFTSVFDTIVNPGGSTIAYEQSADAINWIAVYGRNVLSYGNQTAGSTFAAVTSAAAPACFGIAPTMRYMRARISAFVSGTTVCTPVLRNVPFVAAANPNVNAPSNNIVGKVAQAPYTSDQTPQSGTASGSAASGSLSASLPAVSGKTNYLTALELHSGGATAATITTLNVGVMVGGVTHIYTVPIPAGVNLAAQPITLAFNPPLAASGSNQAITATLATVGAGHTSASINLHGYAQ